jgi:hypothetical protein
MSVKVEDEMNAVDRRRRSRLRSSSTLEQKSQTYLVQPDGTIDGHPLSFERLQPVTRRAVSVRDIRSVRT